MFFWLNSNENLKIRLNSNENLKIKVKKEVIKIIKGLILAEGDNNPHGTGLFVMTEDGKTTLVKRAYEGKRFLLVDEELINYWIWYQNPKLILGHLRYTTSGDNSQRNVHPHRFTKVIGMHNGVLDINALKEIAKKYNTKIKKGDSDTKIFYRIFNQFLEGEKSPQEALRILEEEKIGAYTFVFIINEEIYVIRNGRPWVFFETPWGLFGSSTKKMFFQALYYAGLEKKVSKIKKIGTSEDILYRISSKGEIQEVCKIKPPEPKIFYSSFYHYYPTYNYYDSYYYYDAIDDYETYLDSLYREIEIAKRSEDWDYLSLLMEELEDLKRRGFVKNNKKKKQKGGGVR
jgi:predicted glutamine amidotransferase